MQLFDGYQLVCAGRHFSFLAAGVWFARNLLRTLRVFQEQVGALLKLSITAGVDSQASAAHSRRYFADTNRYWLAPAETQSAGSPEPVEPGPDRVTTAWRCLVLWLHGPMQAAPLSTWRRLVTWLQAPAGT